MKKIFLIFLILLVAIPCCGDDFTKLFKGLEIAWNFTPDSLYKNWESNINVFWIGKGSNYEIYSDKEGCTNVLWHFKHYNFVNAGPEAIDEPFVVENENSGTFLLHLILTDMTIDEADQLIKNHNEPYYILIAGQPKYKKEYKGSPTVVIESDRWFVSDNFKIRFIKTKP